jgi:hypothetical protein
LDASPSEVASPDPDAWARKVLNLSAATTIMTRLPHGEISPTFVDAICRRGLRGEIALVCERLQATLLLVDQGLAQLLSFVPAPTVAPDDRALEVAPFERIHRWTDERLSRFDDLMSGCARARRFSIPRRRDWKPSSGH